MCERMPTVSEQSVSINREQILAWYEAFLDRAVRDPTYAGADVNPVLLETAQHAIEEGRDEVIWNDVVERIEHIERGLPEPQPESERAAFRLVSETWRNLGDEPAAEMATGDVAVIERALNGRGLVENGAGEPAQ